MSKESTLSPEDINKFGLLPQLSKLFNGIGVTLIYNPQQSGYQGFKLQMNKMKETNKLTTNCHLSWTMGIIHRYPIGKSPGDNCIVYDKNVGINLLNVDINTGLATKIIYPTLNGGINRITIFSNLLATSQYINGQRTATLVELQIATSTMAQVNPITVQSSFDWHTEKIYFTMGFYDGKVVQNFPDDDEVSYATDDIEHYTTVMHDVYTSFMFNNGIFGGWFDLVILTQNDAGIIIPDPLDTNVNK